MFKSVDFYFAGSEAIFAKGGWASETPESRLAPLQQSGKCDPPTLLALSALNSVIFFCFLSFTLSCEKFHGHSKK